MSITIPDSLKSIAITPQSASYHESTSTFFRGGAPAVLFQPTTVAEVQDVVRFAADNRDLDFSLRSGGHGIAGRSTNVGGVVLDMKKLNAIELLDNGLVRVQAGARWLDVARFLEPHGLAISSGDYGGVGVGGLATGGGSGWLVREYGLTIDRIEAVEMVLADGELVRADANNHPDLFWAARGAGSAVGVAVSFEIRPIEVSQVGYATFAFSTDDIAQAMVDWAQALENAPRKVTSSFITGPVRGAKTSFQVHTVVNSDQPEEIEELLKPFMELGQPIQLQAQVLPYRAIVDNVYPGPHAGRGEPHSRSGSSEHLTPELAQQFAQMLQRGQVFYFQIRALGGATNDVPVDATAFAHRTSNFTYSALGATKDSMNSEWDKVRPFFAGLYSNFDSDMRPERLTEAFPPATLTRLREVKQAYDPTNLFNDNRPLNPENSKEKSMSLTNKTSVLIGATGNVGPGLIRAHLAAGANVVVVGRNEARLQRTIASYPEAEGRISGVVGDISTFASAEKLAQDLQNKLGTIDNVVIGLNAWMQGEPFWQVSESTWQKSLDIMTAYYAAARALTPRMTPGGSISLILGLSAYIALPVASPVTVYGGALRAMRPAFSQDAGAQVRFNTAAFAPINSASRGGAVSDEWLTEDNVGEVFARIAASDMSGHDFQFPDKETFNRFVAGEIDTVPDGADFFTQLG